MNYFVENGLKLTSEQQQLKHKLTTPLNFWWFLLTSVPAGWIAGMRLRKLDAAYATTSVPFKFLNKNPFKSIYFAVQSMAAELSTAALILLHCHGFKPSIAYIIVGLEAKFIKKAAGRTYFTCEGGHLVKEAVDQCMNTGESAIVNLKTIGRMTDGTVVSEFVFSWSIKQRSN